MEQIVKRIVQALDGSASLSQDQRDIAEYALYNVFTTCATLIGLAVVSRLIGVVPASFMALATGAAFRWSMGGAHYSSPWHCVSASIAGPTAMAVMASWVPRPETPGVHCTLIGLVSLIVISTGVVIWLYSPADTENNPIPERKRLMLRRWSFITLALWSALAFSLLAVGNVSLVVASSLALARQSLSVTPIGYRLFSKIDTALRASPSLRGRRRRGEETAHGSHSGWPNGCGC